MGQNICPKCMIRPVSRPGEICSSCQSFFTATSTGADYSQPAEPSVSSSFSSPDMNTETADDGYQPVSRTRRQIRTPSQEAPVTGKPMRGSRINRGSADTPAVQQPYQPAPARTDTQNQTAAPRKAEKDRHAPIVSGIVKNVTTGKSSRGKLTRWFDSLFMGIPYARTDDRTEFQVYANWTGTASNGSPYSADKVVVYGHIESCGPTQDNSVDVYGVRDRNNVVIASKIQSTTDGAFTVFDPEPISATTVRIITLLITLLIAGLIYGIVSAVNGIQPGTASRSMASLGADAGRGMTNVLYAVIGGAVALISGKKAIQNIGRNWKGAGICALIALCGAYFCLTYLTKIV